MRFSLYPRAVLVNEKDRKGTVVSLDAAVHSIRTGEKGLAQNTLKLREMLAKGQTEQYRKQKSLILPAATFSGIFSIRSAKIELADKFTEHNGFGIYDIDDIDPHDLNAIKTVLSLHPNVILVFASPSGTGLKVIVQLDPIPTTQNDREHKHAWGRCKVELDEILSHYSYQCDSGDDPTRLCFLAHDPRVYYQPDKPAFKWDRDSYHIDTQRLAKQQEQKKHQVSDRSSLENREWSNDDIDPKALYHINPDGIHYDDWFRILAACKASGLAWQDVDAWSRQGTKHQDGDIEKRWDGINTTDVSWGTVVYFAQQHGYQRTQRTRQSKLQNADSPPPRAVPGQARPSGNSESLERNRIDRERATDAFLDSSGTETLQILFVKESTGMGKSHTVLAKSKAHGKRTIMNPPHNELAAQAVDLAFQQGYSNPFHLLGREHNWDTSGIAGIPVKMRTATLFKKNNCIMVDEVKKYQAKRLAPRTYCEHKCKFREECPHLAQYKGLAKRDFIASCTPGLLFDLNMRGYLNSLITATDEPTDEELAIDAMMGTESQESKAFDFAILDDYSVSGLYTDVSFTECDFKALKKAWCGTHTGTFAKLMCKAFEKKKPKKILKAIRTAFDTTAEHHDEISESLTQHARLGTIEWASRPKGSKETQRLLAEKEIKYVDGGRRFIPVDADAYTELTAKGIPSVNPKLLDSQEIGEQVRIPLSPVTALMRGVQVQDLTPVWQKGATPIDLIRILLGSIGNDKNAPIHRTFTASKTPVAILTFSIPPQAPVGLIPQIAMLSATSDTADTQQAFDKQSVAFTEHTGIDVEWADGVEVYQFEDARLTSGSVFAFPTDADGKRILTEDVTELTPTAEKRIEKLNDWATAQDGLKAFISYKDFTEQFSEKVDSFDVVTHFDKVTGLNFEGLKFLVVFGYPKVKHSVVMEQARKQFAREQYPLPKPDKTLRDTNGNKISEYIQLTENDTYETEDGILIEERRYIDPRLEKIRLQLSTEKLEQAIGRARHVRWTDTKTIIFTCSPVPNITKWATLFSGAAFNLAEAPSQLSDAMQQIADAEDSGDVDAIMETQGVSQRTARRRTQETRANKTTARNARILELHSVGISNLEIERIMKSEGFEKVSDSTIGRIIRYSSKRTGL